MGDFVFLAVLPAILQNVILTLKLDLGGPSDQM